MYTTKIGGMGPFKYDNDSVLSRIKKIFTCKDKEENILGNTCNGNKMCHYLKMNCA